MSWKEEIFKALFMAFGTLQIIANLNYLRLPQGIALARKQHRELPPDCPDRTMKIKIICMLVSGLFFFIASMISYANHTFYSGFFLTILILFAAYALTEALIYRYWKTTGFAIAAFILLLVYIL